MKQYLVPFLLACWTAGTVASDVRPFSVKVHKLKLQLDPKDHSLIGEDRITIRSDADDLRMVTLLLHRELSVTQVRLDRTSCVFSYQSDPDDPFIRQIRIKLPVSIARDRQFDLNIKYRGTLYDALSKAEDLAFVIGDETRGLIGEEGIYLYKGSYYYPAVPISLAVFDAVITTPEAFIPVSQGNLMEDTVENGRRRRHFASDIPADGFTIAANRFQISSIERDGVLISTYLFAEDAGFAEILLQPTADFLSLYTKMLGPFPYTRFDIVENFFTTGYGLPAFTLLGKQVIQQGAFILRPGHIDHELLHNWWGNYLFIEPGGDNWAEGITSYLSNYYQHELQSAAAGTDYRRRLLQKYAIRVTPENEYPVRDFKWKRVEEDNEIGYGKAAMLFHMLRRQLDDPLFFAGLRRIIQEKGGDFVTWDDFRITFEQVSGKDLKTFFTQWLDLKGGPALLLEPPKLELVGDDFLLSGGILQSPPYYDLELPIRITFQGGAMDQVVRVSGPRTPLRYRFKTMPYELEIDPDAHIFKILSEGQILPCLNRTIHSANLLVVTPSRPREGNGEYYSMLAERLASQGIEVVPDTQMDTARIDAHPLFLLGLPDENSVTAELAGFLPVATALFTDDSCKIMGSTYTDSGTAVLLSTDHPRASGLPVTIYGGFTPDALQRSRLLFFYGWDGFIVYKSGRPIQRGDMQPTNNPLAMPIAGIEPMQLTPELHESLQRITESNVKKVLYDLSAKEFKGRKSGGPGDAKTQKYLKRRFSDIGLEPLGTFQQKFNVVVQDVKSAVMDIHLPDQQEPLRFDMESGALFPMPGFSQDAWERLEVVYFPVGVPSATARGLDELLPGRIIMTPMPPADPCDPHAGWRELVELAGRNLAAGIIVIADADAADCPWCAYPSRQTASVQAGMVRSARRYPYPDTTMAIAGYQQRSPRASRTGNGPGPTILVLSRPGFETLSSSIAMQSDAPMLLEGVKIIMKILSVPQFHPTANLIGVIRSTEPDAGWLVLGAHMDHLGLDGEGNHFPGADDNASGLTALLAVAEQLIANKDQLRRNILIAAFGGEEWGLQGSRYLVEHPPEGMGDIDAMINLDTIGRNDPDAIHVIGALRSRDLAAIIGRHEEPAGILTTAGLEFAFPYGSDHYSFYLAGIPAVDLCSSLHADYHHISDTPDKVNLDKVSRVARLVFLSVMDIAGNGIRLDTPQFTCVPYPGHGRRSE
ncbi:M20/M25/M40 family metallo-hydrolase [bacterium]|nr:M20/M25/M40 family metallo-hydrolase [candidate division CSSED10-310 bacterium]